MSKDPFLPFLQRIAGGDKESFRALYEKTSHRLTVYLYRLVSDRECVEDILIETYTQVWISSANFEGRSLVLSWMIGIARNMAFKEMGRRQYHDGLDDHPDLVAKEIDTNAGSRKELLVRAVGKLSLKHREILDLAFYHDLPYQEIGTILNIPENTVKSRVFYAKTALRKTLAKMGINNNDF